MKKAELEAIMAITSAKDLGEIKKRNILKIDKKINEKLRIFLFNEGAKYNPSLPEIVAMKYKGRKLPAPKALFQPTGECLTRDLLNWKSLPADLKEEETLRMHSFLLTKPNESSVESFGYRPYPLVFAASGIDP